VQKHPKLLSAVTISIIFNIGQLAGTGISACTPKIIEEGNELFKA